MFTLLLLLPAAAPPPILSPTAHGDRLRDRYFLHQARQIGESALSDIRSKQDWERRAPEMRRQFLDMMGLWPLPPRTDLKPVVTGKLTTPHYRVEKLHFQSMPGLYVTANLYLPLKVDKPAPAVLYVCGHGRVKIGKVSFGNKVTYQHHGAWLAENGFVCLIVDTLQLGEIEGLHHGTNNLNMWWWVSLGYTPAGVELWNGIRALDYLSTRPEVDPKRLGVAGRSGGGATSWWVMAADQRVQAAVPVAGIADLRAHLSEGYPGRLQHGVIAGHCDCMYMVNTYRWDYTHVMALCAPRAVLLSNSDADQIFPVAGYRRMATPVRRLYALLGASEKFDLHETRGPHKDTPELRDGEYRWLTRWLKNERIKVDQPERPRHTPQELKVFEKDLPTDAINAFLHERFRRPAKLEIPASAEVAREWWKGKSSELKRALLDRSFRGWPQTPPPLAAKVENSTIAHGVRVTAVSYLSEELVPLRAWLITPAADTKLKELMVEVCDEPQWQKWLADLGPDFKALLHEAGNPPPLRYPAPNPDALRRLKASMQSYGWGFAILPPRGVGPTRFSPGLGRQHILRRYYLIGQTLEGQQVWDVRRGLSALTSLPTTKGASVELQATGSMAGIAVYAALFEPSVKQVRLSQPSPSHRQGPTFFHVLSLLDMPQAVALLGRKALLEVASEEEAKQWDWPIQLQKKLGHNHVEVKVVLSEK